MSRGREFIYFQDEKTKPSVLDCYQSFCKFSLFHLFQTKIIVCIFTKILALRSFKTSVQHKNLEKLDLKINNFIFKVIPDLLCYHRGNSKCYSLPKTKFRNWLLYYITKCWVQCVLHWKSS